MEGRVSDQANEQERCPSPAMLDLDDGRGVGYLDDLPWIGHAHGKGSAFGVIVLELLG